MDIDMTEYKQYEIIPNEEMWRVNFIKELIDIKHGIKIVAKFDTREIDSLLQFIIIFCNYLIIKPFMCLNK